MSDKFYGNKLLFYGELNHLSSFSHVQNIILIWTDHKQSFQILSNYFSLLTSFEYKQFHSNNLFVKSSAIRSINYLVHWFITQICYSEETRRSLFSDIFCIYFSPKKADIRKSQFLINPYQANITFI